MRILITGGSGVLGRSLIPLLEAAGHMVNAPRRTELDLFDRDAVRRAADGIAAVYHLATRIPPPASQGDPAAWAENDRLRRRGTTNLVDAALEADVGRFLFASIAFVYPRSGPVDESTEVADDLLEQARSALDAEREVARFAQAERTGVVLRLGLLYGPGTGHERPAARFAMFGATLQIEDAGRALAAALLVPSGTYNVVGDDERVSNARFKAATGWTPRASMARSP